jgi:hypothetical protein
MRPQQCGRIAVFGLFDFFDRRGIACFDRNDLDRNVGRQRHLFGIEDEAIEGDPDLTRVAPDDLAFAPRGTVAREPQCEVLGYDVDVFDVDAAAGVGDVGQNAAMQSVGAQRNPCGVAHRPADSFSFVFCHEAFDAADRTARPCRSYFVNVRDGRAENYRSGPLPIDKGGTPWAPSPPRGRAVDRSPISVYVARRN